ncbi:MAG: AAA family ATPase [Acidobacteriota bacterium]
MSARNPTRDAADARDAPMIGRAFERDLIDHRWQAARAGRGQYVLITGEAGVGKSRLMRAFRDRLPGDVPWHALQARAGQAHSPFASVIALLRRQLLDGRLLDGQLLDESAGAEIGDDDDVLAAITRAIAPYRLPHDNAAALLAGLLARPAAEDAPRSPIAASLDPSHPEIRRRRTLEVVLALWLAMAERTPWVLALEDVHWLDPSSAALLERVIRRAATASLMVLATSRPSATPLGAQNDHLTMVQLSHLNADDSRALIEHMIRLRGRTLAETTIAHILARTDGVPLFIEELTRALLDGGDDAGGSDAIPATLRDSLITRLDRLGPAVARIAQVAAVIGRQFSRDLLAAVATVDGAVIDQGLQQLEAAGLLHSRGFGARTRFTFKHALLQDLAYDTLAPVARAAMHRRIAHTLLRDFPALCAAHPEQVAHHCAASGDFARAIALWHRAGRQALTASAYREAEQHLRRALEQIDLLGAAGTHDRVKLALLNDLGTARMAADGYADPGVAEIWARAQDLYRAYVSRDADDGDADDGDDARIDGPREAISPHDVLRNLMIFHFVRGDAAALGELEGPARRLADDPRRLDPSAQRFFAFFSSARSFRAGDQARALTVFHAVGQLPIADDGAIDGALLDYRAMSLTFEAMTRWLCGQADRARTRVDDALAHARARSHPFTISSVLHMKALFHLMRREGAAAAESVAAMRTAA